MWFQRRYFIYAQTDTRAHMAANGPLEAVHWDSLLLLDVCEGSLSMTNTRNPLVIWCGYGAIKKSVIFNDLAKSEFI